jgi:hypothetical protein
MKAEEKKIYDLSVEIIEGNRDIYFIKDLICFLPCEKTTFYVLFPEDSEKSESIKALLIANRIKTKIEIKNKLRNGDKAAELLALYKLIGDEDERKRLSMNYTENLNKEVTIPEIEFFDSDDKTE